jgi:hypothetical protein
MFSERLTKILDAVTKHAPFVQHDGWRLPDRRMAAPTPAPRDWTGVAGQVIAFKSPVRRLSSSQDRRNSMD